MQRERESGREPVFQSERLMESCDDDQALAQDVLQDFLACSPGRISRLSAAVAAANPALVQLEAHSLKGISLTIGAEALAAAGARLEAVGADGNLADAPALLAETQGRLHHLSDVLAAYLADRYVPARQNLIVEDDLSISETR